LNICLQIQYLTYVDITIYTIGKSNTPEPYHLTQGLIADRSKCFKYYAQN